MILLYLLILPLVFLSGVKLDENDSDFSNEEENLDENVSGFGLLNCAFNRHLHKFIMFVRFQIFEGFNNMILNYICSLKRT